MGTPLTPRRAGLLATAVLATALAGCGGSGSDDNAASASGAAPEAAAAGTDAGTTATDTSANASLKSGKAAAVTGTAPAAAAAVPGAGTAAGASGVPVDIAAGADRKNARGVSVPDAALTGRDVIYTADLTVQVEDVTKAVAQIETAVRAAGGFVAGSERSTDAAPAPVPSQSAGEPGAVPAPAPRSSATLTLRVPPGGFNSVLDRLAELGLVVDRKLTGQDVTETVVDVKSRIASARASVDRIRDLMERAVTLRDVVALEGELSQRGADLDALLAKQTSLKDQTSLATVTVHLKTAEALAAANADGDDEGFTAGLANGWNAFSNSATAGATVLGALVPFAAALLILGPPLWWGSQRIARTAPTLRRKVSPIEPS